VFPAVFFHVLLLSIILGAKLSLNHLSKFWGPPHKYSAKSNQLPDSLSQELSRCSNIEEAKTFLDNYQAEQQDQSKVEQMKSLINEIIKSNGLIMYIYNKFLKKFLPKFMYFDEYYVMTGQENIESLKKRMSQNELKESDYPLLGLIELARLNLDQLQSPERTEGLINNLEGASNHLSNKVLKYWSQNKNLHMRFDVRIARPADPPGMTSGSNIWARIDDSKRRVSTSLGTRSRGFVWFFSFLAWFDQQQRKNQPLILLLDEPGLFLHGTAQADLLRYIETELKGNLQVIYTTHSPFMVDPNHFERVRIVQDKSMDSDKPLQPDEEGTKVITDILEATEDSLFPLQGALGYEIYQSLFIGPNNLVVEGVSDLLYLQAMSYFLDSCGREKLSNKWIVTPVGGSDKVPTFVALLGSQKGLKIATLIDLQKNDTQKIEGLYKRKLLNKKNVLTYADFVGNSEADIEDMFSIDFYLKLVNAEYSEELKSPIKLEMIPAKEVRIIQKLENIFTKITRNNIQFNHYRPARYFAENITALGNSIPTETLNRFEETFKTLNSLL